MVVDTDIRRQGWEFKYSQTLGSVAWADLSDDPDDVVCDHKRELCETVEADTGGADSLAHAGPTTQSAVRTVRRLLFPCMWVSCDSRHPLSRLLPLKVNEKVLDVCFDCAKSMLPALSRKQFRLSATQLRACEEAAVTLTDAMKHTPFESLIFNEFRRLKREGSDSEKALILHIGEKGFIRMCKDAVRTRTLPTDMERRLMVMQTAVDVVNLVESAQKAFGAARLSTASSAAEFMRMMVGDERTVIRAGGGYFCERCMRKTKYDYQWTKATGTGTMSDWFCGSCGYPYDKGRMAGVLTYVDVQDPVKSFIIRCRMPSGTVANFRTALALVNLIRHNECPITDEDAERFGGLGAAFRVAIGNDNDRYYRSFDNLRAVACPATLTRPDLCGKDLPHFKICDGPNDVTLREENYGRGCLVYDLKELFPVDGDAQAELDDGPWKAILRAVISSWGVADAAACDPATLHAWSNCAKATLVRLRTWTFLRAIQRHPPTEDKRPGREASEADMEWASQPFQF